MPIDRTKPLVQVKDLKKYFPIRGNIFAPVKGQIHAVDGLSFEIMPGKSMGLVGESGCGKTTTGKLLVRLHEPTDGEILIQDLNGNLENIAHRKGKQLKMFRRNVQMIFQDPYESLNPRHTIFDIVSEPLAVQNIGTLAERQERVADLLNVVGLTPAHTFMFRFPHELSGGQRQRVAIARALVIEPNFIVADEPTSMLDVSIRIGVMQLMEDLADRFGVSYLYITHDLAVARYMTDHIGVMYLGKMVERAETEELLQNPLHPYTKALLAATPVPDPRFGRDEIIIKGGVSKPIDPKPRCRFYERCPISDDFCKNNPHPPLEDKGGGHYVACYKV
ncbi:MAG TPA: ATP-binding cassette domain-containing protein [Aggregatilineales bacterium]|nr:ATP-binding cassette domain-containing protein [Chloroflexota bacterium]HOA24055.1 ATP-binding cassette domain-containing protein [Aggregatilineales bacterium]HPV07969.1 ATP-binding cassette domain-containing protein [Aggregatilineales bacterium]HQA68537.1 ATP-binding cassette domain-containing protein [Aggregatilineales bacterium]HQE17965.1 ATP-binding cassette domain-containing protein [Aggregatilineales bacterium]